MSTYPEVITLSMVPGPGRLVPSDPNFQQQLLDMHQHGVRIRWTHDLLMSPLLEALLVQLAPRSEAEPLRRLCQEK